MSRKWIETQWLLYNFSSIIPVKIERTRIEDFHSQLLLLLNKIKFGIVKLLLSRIRESGLR